MGYEQERFVESFSPDLICCICLCVLEDPLECKTCQTNFCSSCIQPLASSGKLCPNHCTLQLQKSHRFLRSTLDNLSLKCINTSLGCDQVIKIEKIKYHEQQICQFRQIKCKYTNCPLLVSLKDLEEHQSSCEYQTFTCPECNESVLMNFSTYHSCYNTMTEKLENLLNKFENICKDLEEIKKISNNKLIIANKQVHNGVQCNGCGKNPIEGVRNVCTVCQNFNLCWICYGNIHEEHEFVQLMTTEKHSGVTCDGCYESPIQGVRFKCKICDDFGNFYSDFCHKCKISANHPPHPFSVFSPYCIQVVPIKPEKICYKNGETLIRQWEIFNNSCDKITDMMLVCNGGDSCSNFYAVKTYKIEFPGVTILPLSYGVVTLKDFVFQPIPGVYTAEFQLCTLSRVSIFGPSFSYTLAVVPNSFSG